MSFGYTLIGELIVAFTGTPGSGKTSACNFFAKGFKGNYKADNNAVSVSKQSACIKTMINARPIAFIDTPGFCDASISLSLKNEEKAHALLLAKEGVHAFAFIFDVTSRFSQTHVKALLDFQKFEGIIPFTFVIFTKGKRLASSESEQQKVITRMLNSSPPALKQFMQSINYRYIILESIEYISEDYLMNKSSELIEKVSNIFMENGAVFTCYLLRMAKEMYDTQRKICKQTNLTVDKTALHSTTAKLLRNKLTEDEQMYAKQTGEFSSQDRRAQAKVAIIRGVIFCFFSLIGATVGSYVWPMVGTVIGAMAGLFIGKQIYDYTQKN